MSIKVLHLLSNKGGGIGGAEKFLLDMSTEYDFDRFSVSYCTVFNDGENIFLERLREQDFECFDIKGNDWTDLPKTVGKLVGLMKREKYDIVHTQLLHGSVVGQIAARLAGVPFRVITRQYTTDCYHDGHKHISRFDTYVAQRADRVIAISESVRRDLVNNQVKPEKIELIYNGIDLTPFGDSKSSSDIRKRFDKYLIGFVANLNYRKGHEYLLRAIASVKKEFPQIQLLLLGEGDLRVELENLVKDLEIQEQVSFLGYQKDVPAILKQLDLYVHASTLEPLGIAVIEAMAAGKCVVATEVGGVPEIIQDGKTGFLVKPKCSDSLARSIIKIIGAPDIAIEIGGAARNRVEEVFDIKKVVESYQDVYESLRLE